MTQDDNPPDSQTPIVTLGSAAAKAEPGSDSTLTVLIAFGANFLVAVAKSWAAVLTGSASMVAEAAHSLVHHPCVDGSRWIANAPLVPTGPLPRALDP